MDYTNEVIAKYEVDRMRQTYHGSKILASLQAHMNKWKGCTDCALYANATNKVFFRGHVPCDILFIGEAPGPTEDRLGRPFTGKLADCFDAIVKRTLVYCANNLKGRIPLWCVTNPVLCVPLQDRKVRPPSHKEVDACSLRLREFIDLCKPKLIVAMGDVAFDAIHNRAIGLDYTIKKIPHPGRMVRLNRDEDIELEVKRASLLLGPALVSMF